MHAVVTRGEEETVDGVPVYKVAGDSTGRLSVRGTSPLHYAVKLAISIISEIGKGGGSDTALQNATKKMETLISAVLVPAAEEEEETFRELAAIKAPEGRRIVEAEILNLSV
jgi:hypothetical protein